MPRKLFDHELEELVREMTDLGNTVDDRFEKTIECLRTVDIEKQSMLQSMTMKLTVKSIKRKFYA
ncbi:MAG: hypothetical protein ACLRRA_04210 [Acutalibacteraceae bacterium]